MFTILVVVLTTFTYFHKYCDQNIRFNLPCTFSQTKCISTLVHFTFTASCITLQEYLVLVPYVHHPLAYYAAYLIRATAQTPTFYLGIYGICTSVWWWSWRFGYAARGFARVAGHCYHQLSLFFFSLSLCIAFHPFRGVPGSLFSVCHPILTHLEGIYKRKLRLSTSFFFFSVFCFWSTSGNFPCAK